MRRGPDRGHRAAAGIALAVLVPFAVTATAVAQTSTTVVPTPTTVASTPTTVGPTTTVVTTTTTLPLNGLTPTSVRVGGLGYALQYGGADVGARARFAWANATGGVNGRMIEYLGMRDDGGDPAADGKLADALVSQDRVFAVVPVVTPALAPASFTSAGVPFFGAAMSSQFCASAVGFGIFGCATPPGGTVTSNAWPRLVQTALGSTPAKTAAVIADDSPSGAYASKSLAAAAQSVGLRVVMSKSSLPVPSTGDYTAASKAIMGADSGKAPDVVFAIGSYSDMIGLRAALAAAGYQGNFTDALEYAPQLVAGASGALVFVPNAPVETADATPAMRQLVDDVQQVAPNQVIDESVIKGYLSADLFLQVLNQRPRNLTRPTFLGAADRFTFEIAGVAGPTKFPGAHRKPTPCGSVVQSDGLAFSVKVPYTCGSVVGVS